MYSRNEAAFSSSEVSLWNCAIRTIPIREFAASHGSLLQPHEREFLLAHSEWLEPVMPPELMQGLTASPEIAGSAAPVASARRSGARSAFLSEKGLKLKGCRPAVDGSEFPIEYLSTSDGRISRTTVPFGVMTDEAVIREILGYCFMREHRLAFQAVPLGVWEYTFDGESLGYCLVSRVADETRVEAFLDDPGCTVGDLVAAQNGQGTSRLVAGSEIALRGLNLWTYVESKARLLSSMNFQGGFRGILNSNLGNDVLLPGGTGQKLALCDFDSFFMLDVPESPTSTFLDEFVLRCLVEVIVGSLPILQYVDVPAEARTEEMADLLGAIYFPRSSLWRAYHRRFFGNVKTIGWNPDSVEESVERMRRTEAVADVLSTRVLSSRYFATTAKDRTIYFPHN